MPISKELDYANEDDFNQRYVIPLLHKLGYSVVANFHGSAEFGKDLIFAEIDRFGHVCFNAIQTKYVPIGRDAMEGLVLDCKQAFVNEFTHPQTGSKERISRFYVVNGGSISDQAIDHFFSSITPIYGANARVLQGRDLLVLERWAAPKPNNSIVEKLTGVVLEVRFNQRQLHDMHKQMEQQVEANSKIYIPTSVKLHAVNTFLASPPIVDPIVIDALEKYWIAISLVNELNIHHRRRLGPAPDTQATELKVFSDIKERILKQGAIIDGGISIVLQKVANAPTTGST